MNQSALSLSTIAAAVYGRVSTDQQTTSTQELRCKDYLQYKKLPLLAEFYDDDVSGSIAIWERPNGRRLRDRSLVRLHGERSGRDKLHRGRAGECAKRNSGDQSDDDMHCGLRAFAPSTCAWAERFQARFREPGGGTIV